MGGFTSIPGVEEQDQPQATPQSVPPQPPAQENQPSQPDPLDEIQQSLVQQYKQNTPPAASGGPVRRLLQNFISGMGQTMMKDAGLPTPYEKQQKTLAELQGVATAKSSVELHKMLAGQYGTQPITLPDGSQINVMNKDVAGLQGKLSQAMATQNAAQTKTINVPGVGAFAWDGTKYAPVQGSQLPPHILEPGEAEALGFPKGTTQISQDLYSKAVGAKVKPIAYQQGASGPYEVNKVTGQTRSLGIGNPRSIMVQGRLYPAIDTQNDNALTFVNPFQITNGGGRYVPAGQGTTALNKTSLLEDIRGNVQATRSALTNLDEDFTPAFKAQLALALRSTDPRSSMSSLLNSAAAGSLNEKQQETVIAITNLIENSMAMRSVLGAGQGSDELRSAIQAVIPGPKTPSKEYGLKQLDYFENTLNRLGRGVPKVPLRSMGNEPPRPSNVPAGYVYQEHGPKGRGWYRP